MAAPASSGAIEHFGLQPDIVISAKGLASGFPISAMGASRELMEQGLPGSQGGTYGGNAVACAAALATMEVIDEERLVENAAEQGAELQKGLWTPARTDIPEIDDVRGKGLMLGMEIGDDQGKPDGERARAHTKECEKRGLLLLRCGPYAIRWCAGCRH